jgi:Tol biopolymer transport system component
LILVNADGSNRRLLVEGASQGKVRGFYRPVFSPDGQTIAYVNGGINLYDVATGTSNLVVEDRPGDADASQPREFYVPESFSWDGKKLLVHMLHSDTSSIAVYDVVTDTFAPFAGKNDDDFVCCQFGREIVWSPDSASFYAANPAPGVDVGGLWRVDAATGEVTTIVPYGGGDNTFNFVDEPYVTADGQLYFFYSNYNGDLGPLHRAPVDLEIVRSAMNGTTGRTSLARSESLRMMNEALWASDGGFVIVTLAPNEDVLDGGQAEIVYFDGKPNLVLAPFAREMKWGP